MKKEKKQTMSKKASKIFPMFTILLVVIIASAIYFYAPTFFSHKYDGSKENIAKVDNELTNVLKTRNIFVATHIKTPDAVKTIYMTSWVAGTPSIRKKIIKIADETEINSILIDIKDDTGRMSFEPYDSDLIQIGSYDGRIKDLRELIKQLHDKNIYVIGRIAVFQDPHMVSKRPDLAVRKMSNKDEIWKDHKGISWLDAGSKEVWDYVIKMAKDSYNAGFDEINFDYVRFPSDGNMNDIYYPLSEEKVNNDPLYGKASVIEDFFRYLSRKMRKTDVKLSVDLFGMVTTNPDDLNIGQIIERAFPYFDFIAPMVYPSHYPKGFIGLKNPASDPYKVIKYSMEKAVQRAIDFDNLNKTSTTTPVITLETSKTAKKLRPWLQDFNLGAIYTPDMIRAQIQATYDSGLNSWMLWDASNTYTTDALLPE